MEKVGESITKQIKNLGAIAIQNVTSLVQEMTHISDSQSGCTSPQAKSKEQLYDEMNVVKKQPFYWFLKKFRYQFTKHKELKLNYLEIAALAQQ